MTCGVRPKLPDVISTYDAPDHEGVARVATMKKVDDSTPKGSRMDAHDTCCDQRGLTNVSMTNDLSSCGDLLGNRWSSEVG